MAKYGKNIFGVPEILVAMAKRKAYDNEEIGFVHEDTFITNPWYDETYRFELCDEEAVATYGLNNIKSFILKITSLGIAE
jgi:hypothetical protein